MTTNGALARSYLAKARVKLRALAVFVAEEAHSDVIREAQELVELAAATSPSRHANRRIVPPAWLGVRF